LVQPFVFFVENTCDLLELIEVGDAINIEHVHIPSRRALGVKIFLAQFCR
jgi:hypothetical protein